MSMCVHTTLCGLLISIVSGGRLSLSADFDWAERGSEKFLAEKEINLVLFSAAAFNVMHPIGWMREMRLILSGRTAENLIQLFLLGPPSSMPLCLLIAREPPPPPLLLLLLAFMASSVDRCRCVTLSHVYTQCMAAYIFLYLHGDRGRR